MKASVPLLTASVAVFLTMPASLCQGGTPAALVAIATAAPGQAAGNNPRRAADEMLREARAAIKRADFQRAEVLINDAEKLGVKYDQLTDRWSDTPEVLRKLLAQERSKANGAKAGIRLPAIFGGENQAAQQQPIPNDPVRAAQAPYNPQAANGAPDLIAGEQKARAVSYLKDSRAALVAGDKLAALAAWQKAAATPATYGLDEDSPQRVADDLVRAGIDPARLVPANQTLASPFALRPADIDQTTDRLPQLGVAGTAPPAGAAPTNFSPYNLPAEPNQLIRGPAGGGAFQPVAAPANAGRPARFQEPQRLPTGDANAQVEASRLMAQARLALDQGDLQNAARMAEQAESLNVPDNAFAAGEPRPWQMSLEVNRAMVRREGVVQASGNAPQTTEPKYPVAQGVYNPANDTTRLVPAATNQQSILARPPQQPEQPQPQQPQPQFPPQFQPQRLAQGQPPPFAAAPEPTPGQRLFQEGLQLLVGQDKGGALAKFTEAWKYQDQLDPETRQQLKDKLTFLRAIDNARPLAGGEPPSPLEQVNSQQELLRQKLVREILNEEKAAQQQSQKDPKGALANLQRLRERVAGAEVEPAARKQLLTTVDRLVKELTTFIEQNKATLENTEQNNSIKAEVVRDQEVRLQAQGKLADMVEQFNRLMDEKRYPEAEVIARQATDISPKESVVVQMVEKARLARTIAEDLSIRDRTERGFAAQMMSIGESGVPFDDRNPMVFDVRRWGDLTKKRKGWLEQQRNMSPAELDIQHPSPRRFPPPPAPLDPNRTRRSLRHGPEDDQPL